MDGLVSLLEWVAPSQSEKLAGAGRLLVQWLSAIYIIKYLYSSTLFQHKCCNAELALKVSSTSPKPDSVP